MDREHEFQPTLRELHEHLLILERKDRPDLTGCIYCGASGVELTREHVIPYGLAGNFVLKNASCKECARITSEVELYCLKTMFGNLRMRLDFPSRKKKQRKSTLPVYFTTEGGNIRKEREVPVSQYPRIFVGFKFPPPGISERRNVDEPLSGDLAVSTIIPDLKRHSDPGKLLTLDINFDALLFCRMLAKIAHARAVQLLGPDSFEPLLPDLILGKSKHASFLVGGLSKPEELPKSGGIHELDLDAAMFGPRPFIVVRIRLFSFAGLPSYNVVVGRPKFPLEPLTNSVND